MQVNKQIPRIPSFNIPLSHILSKRKVYLLKELMMKKQLTRPKMM